MTTVQYNKEREVLTAQKQSSMQSAEEQSTQSDTSAGVQTRASNTCNLPTQLTSLIGREREVVDVCALLQRPIVRLLTLTGIGGVGKTCLALHIATTLLPNFPDGICFVPLAPVNDPDQVISTIAQTLGLSEANDQSMLDRLKVYLRTRQLLLVLDNFEQVVAAAPLLIELLQACPDLKALATSRSRLHVRGEYEFQVPPLPLPDLTRLPVDGSLEQYAATALFVQRAREIKHDFRVTAANTRVIAEICVRLDGLPLAIELAAARIKLLSPQQMLQRLHYRLQVLTGGGRDAPLRQQTLRNTLAWSYDLLQPEEQQLFRKLSVFVGGCTLKAVEAVCSGGNVAATQVLDSVESLLDKNLIQQTETVNGETRIVMLETIREYGLECLQGRQETVAVRHAHALFYLALVEEAEVGSEGGEQSTWLDCLEREHENIRAALRWLVEQEGEHSETSPGVTGELTVAEMALRLSGALWWFWMVRGYLAEGRQWLERALLQSEGVAATIRAKALNNVGLLAYTQDDFSRAEAYYQDSLRLFQELSDTRHSAICIYRLGLMTWARGNYALATTLADDALALFRSLGDKDGIADTLLLLAYIACDRAEYARANELMVESLALFKEVNDRWGTAYALNHFARVLYAQGEYAKAQSVVEEGMLLARALDYKGGIAACLQVMGGIMAAQGQYERAARLWGAVEALCKISGIAQLSTEGVAHTRAVEMARVRLGEEKFAATWAEGRALMVGTPLLEQAILAVQAQTPEPVETVKKASRAGFPPLSISPRSILTARELEVLRLLATGLTSAQIATSLSISLLTVNTHVRSIYSKLGVTSRSAATRYAIEHGIV